MQVMGIAVKGAKRAPMREISEVRIDIETGLDGDYRGGRGRTGKRQVTILTDRGWMKACTELGIELPWTARRANILLSYGNFCEDDVGRRLEFDGGVILEITGECDPCERMDEVHPGLCAALMPNWRAGATCRVIRSGTLRFLAPMWFEVKAA